MIDGNNLDDNIAMMADAGATAGQTKMFNSRSRFYFNNGNQQFTNDPVGGVGPAFGNWSVPDGGAATYGDHNFYLNGVAAVPTATTNAANQTNFPAAGTFRIGQGTNNPFIGDIGEVIIYNEEFNSPAERAAVNSYLIDKWALRTPSVNIDSFTLGAVDGGALLLSNHNWTINATSTDAFGGTIAQVEFFVNGVSLGVDTTGEGTDSDEYSVVWAPTVAGDYVVTAIATDTDAIPLLALDSTPVSVQDPIFVSVSGAGAMNGSSFADAMTLPNAVIAINSGSGTGVIFMQAGNYLLVAPVTIAGAANISIFGGFAGTESAFNERTGTSGVDNVTLLDGQNATQILSLAGILSMDRLTMTRGNSATNGGAVALSGGQIAISDCIFSNCTAAVQGGAVYVGPGAVSSFDNSSFNSNTALDGGAIFVDGNPGPSIDNCDFTGNIASDGNGGAINYHITSPPAADDCTFTGNQAINRGDAAKGRGGASYQDGNGTQVFHRCIFDSNSATQSGGAMGSVSANNFNSQAEGCLFVNNTAGVEGGAIALFNTYYVDFEFNTFYGNEGGTIDGILLTGRGSGGGDDQLISNNIFAGHDNVALQTSSFNAAEQLITNNLYIDGTAANTRNLINPETFPIILTAGDPLFANAVGGDFHLVDTSVVVNAADMASGGLGGAFAPAANDPDLTTDLDGRTRLGVYDLGAYELATSNLTASPATADFGIVDLNLGKSIVVTVTNNTANAVTVTTLTLSASAASVFTADTATTLPVVLQVGESFDIDVNYLASANISSAANATLTVVNDAAGGDLDIPIVATPSSLTRSEAWWQLME